MPIHTILGIDPLPSSQQLADSQDRIQNHGIYVAVQISIPDALAQTLVQARSPIPAPVNGGAIIDTGATKTAIDDAIAVTLGLPVVNQIMMGTAAGPVPQNVYGAQISFPGYTLPDIPFIEVAGANLASVGLAALIGRDFLVGKVMIYDGTLGTIKICW